MDNLDALLAFALFMAFVGGLPSEAERAQMTFGQFLYALFYRFLQNACINVKSVVPALGVTQRVESVSTDGHGGASKTTVQTVATAAPLTPASSEEQSK